jgi:uncharacterized membrane protein
MRTVVLVVLIFALAGCTAVKPLKPGSVSLRSGGGFASEMKQPENPAQAATQNFERTTETELPLAAGSKVVEMEVVRDDTGRPVTRQKTMTLTEPTIQKTRVVENVSTVIGAAQKDNARELGAKLASMKGIVWVGVVLFLFGLATLFYPPLRVFIGSVTTSAAILVGGLALMVLPSLIVGNELLILGGVALAVGGWFLAHRHGQLRGMVDANKNGIDDRLETRRPQ